MVIQITLEFDIDTNTQDILEFLKNTAIDRIKQNDCGYDSFKEPNPNINIDWKTYY